MRFDHLSDHKTPTLLAAIFLATLCSALLATLLSSTSLTPAYAQSEPQAIHGTTIVVDTSADLDQSNLNTTCTYDQGAFFNPAVDGCTLRRAIIEASARPADHRPITITFNLPMTDTSANLEVNGTWALPLNGPLVLKTQSILDIDGSVTIDGSTQPGGRGDGPPIIIDTNDHSFEIESENNLLTNLAFKGGGAIFLKENGNIIDQIWMGLSDNGQEISFREPGNEFRMAHGGIRVSANNNIIEDSTISGAFAPAIDIDGGDNNLIQNNQIGTRADGTVPNVPIVAQCAASFVADGWYGGWGISLTGSNNQILNNHIAGLNIVRSGNDTPPIALQIFGSDHMVSGNIIGVDFNDQNVGVCGQGIQVSATDTVILENEIVASRTGFDEAVATAIMGTGAPTSFNRVTVRGNLIQDGPGNVYAFAGTGVPDALKTFNPAKVTSISGVTVEGTSGDDSPCPNCTIDLYTDDLDAVGEALAHLGSTTADANGHWSFTLVSALGANTAIRTSSTVPAGGIIDGFGAGTTTKVSKLYYAMQDVTITGPISGVIGTTYSYSITVAPVTAIVPIDFIVQATDKTMQTVEDSLSHVVVGSYNWSTPGTKTISVTVENDLSTLMGTLDVEIVDPTVPMSSVEIQGPTTGEVGVSYEFTITVLPNNATGPFDFTVNSTDNQPLTSEDNNSPAVTASLAWDSPGVKNVEVVVETDTGNVTTTLNITIAAPSPSGTDLFMPKLDR